MPRQDEAGQREDFTRTARELERWRARRKRGERIPELLWASATVLARSHGVARTAAALRLDYYSVKRRLAASELAGPRDTSRPRFVELALPDAAAPGISCTLTIESETKGRQKLRVELAGISPSDLGAVIRAAREQYA